MVGGSVLRSQRGRLVCLLLLIEGGEREVDVG